MKIRFLGRGDGVLNKLNFKHSAKEHINLHTFFLHYYNLLLNFINEKYGMLFMIIQLILRLIPIKRFLFNVNSEIVIQELFLKRMKHRFSGQLQVSKRTS